MSEHQEVEFMFEFYGKQIGELASLTSELNSHIRKDAIFPRKKYFLKYYVQPRNNTERRLD